MQGRSPRLLIQVLALAIEQAVQQFDGRLADVVAAVLALQVRLAAHREHDACSGSSSMRMHVSANAQPGACRQPGANPQASGMRILGCTGWPSLLHDLPTGV